MKKNLALYVLMILSIEKFIQHMFVSYALYVDLLGIRSTVLVDHRILLISGFIIGILFVANIPFLLRRNQTSFRILFLLASFDIIGEFIAQGTLAIDVTVSFLAAIIILLTLIIGRKQFTNEHH